MSEYAHMTHTFEPVYRKDSTILILGSFPSVKSRENQFFYGHPQNRFWKVVAHLTECDVPQTIPDKKEFLLEHKIALWDVIQECDIKGSDDSSIKKVIPNDISRLLRETKIQKIYTNGNTAGRLYACFQEKKTGIPSVTLPSTSPANAAYSVDRLCERWKQILTYISY